MYKKYSTYILLFLLVNLSFGCSSMPKPDGNIAELIEPLNREYKEKLMIGDHDGIIKSLEKMKRIYTSDEKLEGGKGQYFKSEAAITALIAHFEFNRGNFNTASKGWYKSFEIEHAGLTNQNEVERKNAKVVDAIATGVSVAASRAAAQKSGQNVYTYTAFNTFVPKPGMIIAGRPEGTVIRTPARLELAPFDNIVRLKREADYNSGKGYCTGTMVSSRIAISAAHCISQKGEAINPKLISIQRESIFPSQVFLVEKYYTHLGENKGWDTLRKNDWVILITSSQYDKTGSFPQVFRSIPTSIATGVDPVMLAGYSSDLNKGFYLTLHYGCKFKPNTKSDRVPYLTNCETAKGSSGAAVMTKNPPHAIVAIHTAQLVNPTDEYLSVETFSSEFISNLDRIAAEYEGTQNKIISSEIN
jgi:hypothetical protein